MPVIDFTIYNPVLNSPAPADADTNAAAIRQAILDGATGVYIPKGVWYFSEILFTTDQFSVKHNLPLPPNFELFGEGRVHTTLVFRPSNSVSPAFELAPGSSRSVLRDFTIYRYEAPSLGVPAVGTCVQMAQSHFNIVREVEIWNFSVGIDLGPGFTGYTAIENFEINGCPTGIRLRDACNSVLIKAGRILAARTLMGTIEDPTVLPLASEIGVGIDIEGAVPSSEPGGGSGVVIDQVTVENAALCLRIINSHDIVVTGCYFEPGVEMMEDPQNPGTYIFMPNTMPYARRICEIDALSERISIIGTVQSEPSVTGPGVAIPPERWTPAYVKRPLEARGAIELNAFHGTGLSQTNNVWGAGHHGATAAHANHIRNGDFSRDLQFWHFGLNNDGMTVAMQTGVNDYVTGRSSLGLVSSAQASDHIYQDFETRSGVRAITAMVRYRVVMSKAQPEPPAAFRVEISTVDGPNITPLGFYSDTDVSETGWRVRALTARFDGTLTGIRGPRVFRIRLYPYFTAAGGEACQQVDVDSVWVVDGEYAASYRPYQEGVEVLMGDDRAVLFAGTNVGANVAPTGIPPTVLVPINAVGMVTEMSITGATSTGTRLIVNDNTSGGTGDIRELVALVAGRPVMTEYTIPLKGSGTGPQWSISGASATRLVTYEVRLKSWIYRM